MHVICTIFQNHEDQFSEFIGIYDKKSECTDIRRHDQSRRLELGREVELPIRNLSDRSLSREAHVLPGRTSFV